MAIDKNLLKALREDINAALKAVGEKHGVVINAGNAKYDANSATFKLDIKNVSESGEVFDEARQTLEVYGNMYGLSGVEKDKRFGHIINVSGQGTFKIVGLHTNRRKYPFVVSKGGKQYKMTEEMVTSGL